MAMTARSSRLWNLLLILLISGAVNAVQLYSPEHAQKQYLADTTPISQQPNQPEHGSDYSAYYADEHTTTVVTDKGSMQIGNNLAASPLQVVPELKESYFCTLEGDQHLLDDEGFYQPAYPSSSVLGGRCNFDDFDEERVLGRGAFGQVYRARHRATGIRVAIKELTRPVEMRLIRREECIQHRLRSPLIARHFCTISEDGYIAYVMELAEGMTLYKARKRDTNLPIVSIAAQIVLMLEYLHDRYIMYRDLKPENIMYNPRLGTVKLIDFGLAHRLDGPNALTTGQSGTPPFMAPEIVISPTARYSYPADWYSLGLVIFELISGRNPFDSIQDTGLLHRHIVEGFDCNLADKPGCHLISKFVDHDPSRRWGNSSSSRRRIKRHPWFKGIPWTDYERGDISVLLPRPQIVAQQPSTPLQPVQPVDPVSSKNPLRTTLQSSREDETMGWPFELAIIKGFPDEDASLGPGSTTAAGAGSTTIDPIPFTDSTTARYHEARTTSDFNFSTTVHEPIDITPPAYNIGNYYNGGGGGSMWWPPIKLREVNVTSGSDDDGCCGCGVL